MKIAKPVSLGLYDLNIILSLGINRISFGRNAVRRAHHHDIEEWSPHIRNLAPSMPLRILIYYTLERVILMGTPLTEKFSQR